jgi:polyhydroxyalkanoate synthesis regulator phasin
MRKTIAAASIAVGGLGVLGLGATAIAGAQDDASTDDESSWVDEALGGLVDDGTITQEQADAVEDALAQARPDHGPGHPGAPFAFGRLSTIAESLGMDVDDLRSELRDGRTVAEVADDQGVDVQDVVDDIVAAQQERVDQAVADGDLTQDEADEIMAGAEDRVTAFVNGEAPDPEDMPDLGDGRPGPRWGGPGQWAEGEGGPWHRRGPWADDEGPRHDEGSSDRGTGDAPDTSESMAS